MGKSSLPGKGSRILRELLNFSINEYEALLDLPSSTRHKAAIALLLFYGAIVFIIHLAVYPHIDNSPTVYILLFSVYLLMILGASSTSVIPMFFPALRKHIKKIYYVSIIMSGLVGAFFGANFSLLGSSVFVTDPPAIAYYLAFMGTALLLTGMSQLTRVLKLFFTEKTSVETELKIAEQIQKRLVPDITINKPGYIINGKTRAAKSMGGDFFDIYENESELIVCIGDVSGHGISAGLTMAMVKAVLQTELNHSTDPVYLMNQLNHALYRLSDKKTFITFQIMKFDFHKQTTLFVNAGHIPVIHHKNITGSVLLRQSSLALSLKNESNYASEEITFTNGHSFIFCTDGLIEIGGEKDVQAGLLRLQNISNEHSNSLDTMMEKMLAGYEGPPEDDMTLLIVTIQ